MERLSDGARAMDHPGAAIGEIASIPQRITPDGPALGASRCQRCGRPLKDPASRARGMGPVCAARVRAAYSNKGAARVGVEVTVDGRPLRHHPLHSPDGFEWGYGGSGPADLALAILLDYLGDHPNARQIAEALHQQFKEDFVARFPEERWRLPGVVVGAWLTGHGVRVPMRDVLYEGRRTA